MDQTRGKAADKNIKRLLSLDSADNSSIQHQVMAPPTAADKVDHKLVEECVKKIINKDSVFNALVTKLSEQIKTAVQEAVKETLEPLNAEVNALKVQMTELTVLVKKLEGQTKSKTDDLEQYQRRNNIRVFGIPESRGEDTDQLIVKLCQEKLDVDLPVSAICRSHRIGVKSQQEQSTDQQRHRPITVRFVSYRDRRRVFEQKKKLKGSGLVIREDLTATRLEVLRKAVSMFGVRNTWTVDGRVSWINGDGNRGTATRLEDLPGDDRA